MDLVVWIGPGSAERIEAFAMPHPTQILVVGCEGSSGCRGVLPAGGSLRALCAEHGVDVLGYDHVILAGFSAGHGANDQILADPESRDMIDAYACFDSYYAHGVVPGVLAFARDACAGRRLMISTASDPPGAGWRTVEQAIQPLLAEIPGLSRTVLPPAIANSLMAPVGVVGCGNLWHANYGGTYTHGQHATVVAPVVLAWMSQQLNRPASSKGTSVPAVLFGLALVGTVAVVGYRMYKAGR